MLPPQVQVVDFEWDKQGKDLNIEKARSLETFDMSALAPRASTILHRHFSWNSQGYLQFPDVQSALWIQFNPLTRVFVKTQNRYDISRIDKQSTDVSQIVSLAGLKFRLSNMGRTLELLDPKDPSRNFWLLQIPNEAPIEWRAQGQDALWGVSRETYTILHLNPRNLRSLSRWNFERNTQWIDFVTCENGAQMLVEQTRGDQVFTRFLRFRGNKPVSYTIFDFSNGQKKSDILQALSRNCMEFYVTGPHGLQRVRY